MFLQGETQLVAPGKCGLKESPSDETLQPCQLALTNALHPWLVPCSHVPPASVRGARRQFDLPRV
jgi:hypothetical protein